MWTIHETVRSGCIGYIAKSPSSESPWFADLEDVATWFVETGRADTISEALRWINAHTISLEVA